MKNKSLKNDVILILSIVLVSLILVLYLSFFKPNGNKIKVTVNGDLYKTYSLSEDIREDIITDKNSNTLVIKDGKAEIVSATCPDGICQKHYPISREGESIVCLPNRVVITVFSEGSSDAPDIVA